MLAYGLDNTVWQAERRQRITPGQADAIIQAFAGLDIEIIPQTWGETLPFARLFNCSAYDAACLALARALGDPFITADERLYNAVHPALDWVLWMADYPLEGK